MRRSLLISLVLLVAVSAHAQTYNIDFNQFPEFVPAESLGIPGVSFVSNPPQTWFTVDSAEMDFVGLGGICLFQPNTTGTLDITFSTPVSSVSFSYAQDEITANVAQIRVEAFSGSTSVGSTTQSPAPPPGGFFVEGFINFVPGSPFNRIRISSPTSTLIAIDNIQASGPQVTLMSLPDGMLQAAGSGGATDSYTLANRGSVAASVTLSQDGSFFTQSPASFSLAPGGTQTVTLTGLMQGPNAFNGASIVNVSGGQQIRVPVRLLSAVPPSSDSRPVPTTNRVDVVADEGQNPSGSIPFRNTGSSTIQAIAVSDAPWLIPQQGIITIGPGQTVNVSFTIDRSQRREGSTSFGSVFGTLSLRYLTNAPGKTTFQGTGASLVTVVDTTKPKTNDLAIPPLGQGEVAFFLTGVGHVTGGGGVVFISDITIGNAIDTISLGNVNLFFTPREGAATSKQSTIPSLLPNQAISLADVVKNVYNNDNSVGSMQVRSSAIQNLSVAASIFISSDPRGTFGTAIPVIRSDRSITTNGRLVLPGLRQDATHRTNFYLQETRGGTATFRIDFLNAAGNVIGQITSNVEPFRMRQIPAPAPQGAVTAIVTQTSGDGSVSGYATPLDTVSGDTWAVTDWNAAFGGSPTAQTLIPIAGSAPGALGTFFRTDVNATNIGTTTGTVRFTYRPTTGPEVVRDVNLAPNQSFVSTDIVKSLFNVPDASSIGYILVNPLGRSVVATARTYTTVSGSSATFGTAVPSIPLSASLSLGQKKVIGGLEDASLATLQAGTPATFRTNVDVVETNGAAATVRATLLFADGRNLAGGAVASKDYTVQPNQLLRINRITNDILGAKRNDFGDIRNFQLKFEVVGGSGRVAVTVSSTDNGTGDSILRVE